MSTARTTDTRRARRPTARRGHRPGDEARLQGRLEAAVGEGEGCKHVAGAAEDLVADRGVMRRRNGVLSTSVATGASTDGK